MAPSIDDLAYRWSTRPRLARRTAAVLRGYLRWLPGAPRKLELWTRIVEPYFAWIDHSFVARTRFGFRMAGNTSDLIQQAVYFFGVWEPELTHWMHSCLRPGDTMADVGANVGYYSLLASRLVGRAGRVIAVEASPDIFRHLTTNLALNRVANTRALNVAAGRAAGSLPLFAGPTFNIGETTTRPDLGQRYVQDVPVRPLCDLLHEDEIRTLRLIKIDVEGAELDVVEGLLPLLSEAPTTLQLVVEIDPKACRDCGWDERTIVELLAPQGYSARLLPANYWFASYMPPHRPVRLLEWDGGPLTQETHLVFSRTRNRPP